MSHTYDRGFLTAVPGYATSIAYHPNQTVSQVVHANDVQWNQAMDPNQIGRPASISTALATQNWSSGTYAYDGAGNVKKTGNAYFLYDTLSRLKTANLYADISGAGTATQQGYTYDNYANLTAMTGASGVSIPASSATNRLTGAVSYDAAGNLTSWNGNLYDVDAFGMMSRYRPAGQTGVEHIHLYTADDERLWTFTSGNTSRWTLRDLDGRVLREFANNAGTWSLQKDYVFRGSTLVAAVQPNGQTYHLHPDHLGTPRLITNAAKAKIAYHVYYPYGGELSPINQDGERMKFTGHERDLGVLTSNADDLDYMHARFCSPLTGRFLSVDPKPRRSALPMPQRWNRYGYAAGNPLKYIDPDGEDLKIVYNFSDSGLTQQEQIQIQTGLRGVFVRAGVRNVQTYGTGGSIRPRATEPTDRVVKITITSRSLGEGVYGRTSGSSGKVSTEKAPDAQAAKVNFLTNVAAHEIGHASGALPQYSGDAAAVGSLLNPMSVQPEPGTTMETRITPEELSGHIRDFSDEDARRLRLELNDDEIIKRP